MSSELAATYLESHAQLSTWNDELEFLGFILAELTDPCGLEANGFPWHQAADFPAMVEILHTSCVAKTGILKRVFGVPTLKNFKKWLREAKQIRNAIAHHQSVNEQELCSLKAVRDELCELFESAIRMVAAYCNIHEIPWCPYPYTSTPSELSPEGDAYKTEPILLSCGTEPLLSQRHRILESLAYRPENTRPNRKRKAPTTKSRQEELERFIEAQQRKLNRRQQIKAREEEMRARKLQILDENYHRMRQLRLTQLDDTRNLLEHEEKVWEIQRSVLLEDTSLSYPADDNAVSVILTLSSPLWLLCLFIRTIYRKCKLLAAFFARG
ncbi:hypothetical protein BJX70DRAFT_401090 [Aspergillus crustosus]